MPICFVRSCGLTVSKLGGCMTSGWHDPRKTSRSPNSFISPWILGGPARSDAVVDRLLPGQGAPSPTAYVDVLGRPPDTRDTP